MNDDTQLDDLFRRYREAIPEVEPSVNFMPMLWQRIDAKPNFWLVFPRLARAFTTASAALCLVLLALNLVSSSQATVAPTYTDALMADHSAEMTYYGEAIRASSNEPANSPVRSR
jgi:hypothetical protein